MSEIPPYQENGVEISHQEGAKNPWQVVCEFEKERKKWLPKNRDIFNWVDHWFRSEDYEYSLYGCKLPWWFVTQIARDNPDVAKRAIELEEDGEKAEMVTEFEKNVVDNADEVVEMIRFLEEKCEKRLKEKGELQ